MGKPPLHQPPPQARRDGIAPDPGGNRVQRRAAARTTGGQPAPGHVEVRLIGYPERVDAVLRLPCRAEQLDVIVGRLTLNPDADGRVIRRATVIPPEEAGDG